MRLSPLAAVGADAHAALVQAWPAFALVAGLLLVGAAAAHEGLFAAAGNLAARARGGATALFVALLLLEAAVTAVLNLDTAVVFLTPVLVHAARHRGVDETPFLYGAVLMANAASPLLPGSNLTNLIVLAHERTSGTELAARIWPAWVVSVVVTVAFLAIVFRRRLRGGGFETAERVVARPRAGSLGVALAAALVLTLSRPAVPVLALGVAVVLLARVPAREAVRAANPLLLAGVLGIAVAFGTAGRAAGGLGDLVRGAGRWGSAWLGAGAAVVVNNLPAAALLSAQLPANPRALLLGLDLGPNLAVTGSLSAVLWLHVARENGAQPSALRYSLLGAALVPISLTLALLTGTSF